jgi:hypothetical protein
MQSVIAITVLVSPRPAETGKGLVQNYVSESDIIKGQADSLLQLANIFHTLGSNDRLDGRGRRSLPKQISADNNGLLCVYGDEFILRAC